jgi:hypothetical protein
MEMSVTVNATSMANREMNPTPKPILRTLGITHKTEGEECLSQS